MAKVAFRTADGRRVVADVLVKDLRGRTGRTLRVLRNSLAEVPAGSKVEIGGAWRSGFNVDTILCGACKTRVFFSQVHRDAIEVDGDPPARGAK